VGGAGGGGVRRGARLAAAGFGGGREPVEGGAGRATAGSGVGWGPAAAGAEGSGETPRGGQAPGEREGA